MAKESDVAAVDKNVYEFLELSGRGTHFPPQIRVAAIEVGKQPSDRFSLRQDKLRFAAEDPPVIGESPYGDSHPFFQLPVIFASPGAASGDRRRLL